MNLLASDAFLSTRLQERRNRLGGIDMIRKVGVLVLVVVGIVSVSAFSVHAATTLAKSLQQVDGLLDRALHNLSAADELVDKKQLAGTDQMISRAIQLAREAEQKIDNALATFRTLESGKPSKAQLEDIEKAIGDARAQLREAEAMIDKSGKRTQDYKLLRGLVTGADHRIDQAMKMLRKIAAGL